MSRISVLVFAPTDDDTTTATTTTTTTTTPSTDRASRDSSTTTLPNDIAFLAESQRHRFINLHKPYSLLYNRSTSSTGSGTPYTPFAHQPLLKVHIATVRDVSSSLLPSKLSRTLKPLATKTPTTQTPEDWLDAALTALQKAGLVQRFSVPKFHQFLVATTLQQQQQPQHGAGRRVSCGTTELDYLALLSSNSEVKKMLSPDPAPEEEGEEGEEEPPSRTWTICGFRISSGGRQGAAGEKSGRNGRRKSVNEWERQDDPYGGLM